MVLAKCKARRNRLSSLPHNSRHRPAIRSTRSSINSLMRIALTHRYRRTPHANIVTARVRGMMRASVRHTDCGSASIEMAFEAKSSLHFASVEFWVNTADLNPGDRTTSDTTPKTVRTTTSAKCEHNIRGDWTPLELFLRSCAEIEGVALRALIGDRRLRSFMPL